MPWILIWLGDIYWGWWTISQSSIGDGDGGGVTALPHQKWGFHEENQQLRQGTEKSSRPQCSRPGWCWLGGWWWYLHLDRLAQATAMFDHSKLSHWAHWVSWYKLFVHCEYRNLSPAAEMWTARSCVGELMPSVRHIHEAIPRSIGYRILKLTSGVDRWAQRGL